MVLVLLLPESPRWLIAHDKTEEALAIFAKYHGDGDVNAPIVQLQHRQILEEHQNSEPGRWWDYRELVVTRSARYRIYLVIAVAFFGQWSGNNVVSYFMVGVPFLPGMLKTAAKNNTNTQLLINACNAVICWISAMVGATLLDKLGRRHMMMGGLTGALASYILLTAFTAQAQYHASLSYGVIVFIFTFGVCFAAGMTPNATLYPMEVPDNRTHAKGSAIKFLFLNIAFMTNTFGVSVGIRVLQWKLYIIYICWIAVEISCIFLFFVETKGKTLEELKDVFEAKNPREASTRKVKVEIDAAGNVIGVEESGGITKA